MISMTTGKSSHLGINHHHNRPKSSPMGEPFCSSSTTQGDFDDPLSDDNNALDDPYQDLNPLEREFIQVMR